MRKFTESISSRDIFDNIENLHSLLIEFRDSSIEYNVEYNIQRYFDNVSNTGGMYPIGIADNFNDVDDGKIKSYVIRLNVYDCDVITSDRQRTGTAFYIPGDKVYELMTISQDIQAKVEGLGHTFTLSIKDYNFSIMIIEGKHKKLQ